MQKVIQGQGSIEKLNSEIVAAGFTKAFLVTGGHFCNQMDQDFDFLPDIRVRHFIKSGLNVTDQEITFAFSEYSKSCEPVIIAIGGGSVIDIAKAIIYECLRSSDVIPLFIAIPTTGGSGSEATQFAVIYNNKKKVSLQHPQLQPRMVILDSRLTYSLPAFQAAASGMDVLSQAIESYWNIHATDQSRSYAVESIKLWKRYFAEVVAHPGPESRDKMLYASHLSGKAINITRTTGPHALSYFLTAEYGIVHGQAVALFLPVFFIYNKPQLALCELLQAEDEYGAMRFIQKIMKQAGMAVSFAELGLKKGIIMNQLLDSVNEERFANNPRIFDKKELQDLFHEYL